MDTIKIVIELCEKGVQTHIFSMGLAENTLTGRLVFNVMSAFAEFKRDIIQEGKVISKH
ncbi:recombinase family protein [Bacillus cereus]